MGQIMQIPLTNCQEYGRGPFVSDKGFPSELDLTSSIKVIVWTWHLEALKSEVEMFFVCFFYLCSLLFLVKKEEWFKRIILDTNQSLQGEILWRE